MGGRGPWWEGVLGCRGVEGEGVQAAVGARPTSGVPCGGVVLYGFDSFGDFFPTPMTADNGSKETGVATPFWQF